MVHNVSESSHMLNANKTSIHCSKAYITIGKLTWWKTPTIGNHQPYELWGPHPKRETHKSSPSEHSLKAPPMDRSTAALWATPGGTMKNSPWCTCFAFSPIFKLLSRPFGALPRCMFWKCGGEAESSSGGGWGTWVNPSAAHWTFVLGLHNTACYFLQF